MYRIQYQPFQERTQIRIRIRSGWYKQYFGIRATNSVILPSLDHKISK